MVTKSNLIGYFLTCNTCILEFNNIITLLIWMDSLYIIHLKDPYVWIGTKCNTIHLFWWDCNNVVAFQCWFSHFEVEFRKMKVIRCLDATTNSVMCGLYGFPFQFMFFLLFFLNFSFFLDISIHSKYEDKIQMCCLPLFKIFIKKINWWPFPSIIFGGQSWPSKILVKLICCIKFQCPIACAFPNYGVEEFCSRSVDL